MPLDDLSDVPFVLEWLESSRTLTIFRRASRDSEYVESFPSSHAQQISVTKWIAYVCESCPSLIPNTSYRLSVWSIAERSRTARDLSRCCCWREHNRNNDGDVRRLDTVARGRNSVVNSFRFHPTYLDRWCSTGSRERCRNREQHTTDLSRSICTDVDRRHFSTAPTRLAENG